MVSESDPVSKASGRGGHMAVIWLVLKLRRPRTAEAGVLAVGVAVVPAVVLYVRMLDD